MAGETWQSASAPTLCNQAPKAAKAGTVRLPGPASPHLLGTAGTAPFLKLWAALGKVWLSQAKVFAG
jgi:hypothetical protein